MNWLLVVVIIIMAGCALKGRRDGLIKTVFSIFSVVIALVVTMIVSPAVSGFLQRNEKLTGYVEEKVENALKIELPEGSTQKEQLEIIDKLPLPHQLKEQLVENKNTEVYKAMAVDTLQDYVNTYVTKMIINAGTFIIMFIALNILLMVIANVLNIFSRLPVINALNKTAGFFVGLLQGLLIIWVLCIVLTVFSSTEIARQMYAMINENSFLSFLYNNNMLLKSVADVVKGLK